MAEVSERGIVCPYLRGRRTPTPNLEPGDDNHCILAASIHLPRTQQMRYCLGGNYEPCPRFQRQKTEALPLYITGIPPAPPVTMPRAPTCRICPGARQESAGRCAGCRSSSWDFYSLWAGDFRKAVWIPPPWHVLLSPLPSPPPTPAPSSCFFRSQLGRGSGEAGSREQGAGRIISRSHTPALSSFIR